MGFDSGRHQSDLDRLNANVRVNGKIITLPTGNGHAQVGEVVHRETGAILATVTLEDEDSEQAACDAAVAAAMAAHGG